MKTFLLIFLLFAYANIFAQVDTSFVYNTSTSYGTLDLRIAKSTTRYYYLMENKTFSFRESAPGVKTDTYKDMTSWNSTPYTQGNLREKNGSADNFVMNYRLLFPVTYRETYSPGYPIIVFMHGAGERGNCWDTKCYHGTPSWNPVTNSPAAPTSPDSLLLNNDNNLTQGGGPHMDARNLAGSRLPNDPSMPTRGFPGFILFPQNLNGWSANTVQDAIRIVRLVAKKYNIDENRIYIEGLSDGAAGVYEAIKRAPWLFAAALPMSPISDGGITTQNQAANVAHIPLWIFQGAKDTSPTPSKTEGYIKKFREAGTEVRYTLYPNLAHGTWNTAFKEPDFFLWLLGKNKSTLHTFSGSAAICLTNGTGVKMEMAQGFLKYEWRKDGVTIPGATTASYTATTVGLYSARFSRILNPTEAQWNSWSPNVSVTQQNPAQAVINQTGTVILKDLNNGANAKLNAVGNYAHYYWYKDGALIDLSGTVDDTVKYPLFKPGPCTTTCTGSGAYTLITAGYDNCPSPVSAAKYVIFNNLAPINITAPTTFTGSILSPTSIQLNWVDNATNENGYEIWSRRKIGTSYTAWTMRTLTIANATTFTDNGLEPSSIYNYKIRGVNNTGRSDYTPLASNQYLVLTTTADTVVPTAPANLVATNTGIKTVTLTWQPATDNTGIRRYQIYYGSQVSTTTSNQTTIKLTGLDLNTTYTFTVKAEDLGGNLSSASNSASASTFVTGLYYEHSTGAWGSLDLIDWSNAEFSGTVPNFTLTPRTQEDYFNFKFEGYLYITTGGLYQFRTISDDGSRVELDSVVVVDNNGVHESKTVTGAIQTLTAGPKAIVVRYFEFTASQTLTVKYKGPDTGNLWVTIPNSVLQSGTTPMPSAVTSNVTTEAAVISVYPNPSNTHSINLKINTPEESQGYITLVDLAGKPVYEGRFEAAQLREGIRIQMREDLKEGMYIIHLHQNNISQQRRISIRN
ncbi:MAG TPA: fibronectin type III domain-containing protein [Cyclobacteriaceae bacterium]|nr:fibronectin type III domain-containing protein [Cyclobacteriaceae bacterium]